MTSFMGSMTCAPLPGSPRQGYQRTNGRTMEFGEQDNTSPTAKLEQLFAARRKSLAIVTPQTSYPSFLGSDFTHDKELTTSVDFAPSTLQANKAKSRRRSSMQIKELPNRVLSNGLAMVEVVVFQS